MRTDFFKKSIAAILSLLVVYTIIPTAFAASDFSDISGTLYEFEENSHYIFSEATETANTSKSNTYGTLSLKGNVSEYSLKGSTPAYRVDDGTLSVVYSYTDALLNAGEDEWHIVDDKSKKIDSLTLDENIMKGAIVVQISKDQKNWTTVAARENVFSEVPADTATLYTAKDIEAVNGCFYRVTVAYELSRRTEQNNIWFVDTSKYENKKCAEVYDFYIYSPSTGAETVNPNQTYNLGKPVRTKEFDGYSGEKAIEKDDPHYGITLGQFFVSGYTDTATDAGNDIVFLKNVGDKVTLWFRLNENIDGFQSNPKVTVTADSSGRDQYFQTEATDFGRGALIIKYTDYKNASSKPQIYVNYLEANASVGADTTVKLCEEGDYEVALDYELTEDKLIDTEAHYRIFFKFSVRNGNCMVYPFDLATGSELTNSAMTENGFRLDLAKSRYLKVNVKREMLADSADGLVEDVRFNGPAKDGAEYKDDGIYTITVTNQYTKQSTEKRIYVGTNPVLKAYVTTGLTIPEINNLVAKGAKINSDGTITEVVTTTPEPQPAEDPAQNDEPAVVPDTPQPEAQPQEATESTEPQPTQVEARSLPVFVYPAVGVVVVAIAAILIASKKKATTKRTSSNVDDGGNDQ